MKNILTNGEKMVVKFRKTFSQMVSYTMTSISYGRIFCLESQKIDGTEYLRGSTDFAIFFILLNLEAWNLVGVYKIENK